MIRNIFSKENSNIPVVFVPGLFGSMGEDIIPGTGNWHFGIAGYVYNPFIELLESIGYKLNKTLFISFYDWRKSCTYSAQNYLMETIQEPDLEEKWKTYQ